MGVTHTGGVPMSGGTRPDRRWSWLPTIAAAIIGAAATIGAGLIANKSGVIKISISPVSTPTVDTTPRPGPRVPVTKSVASGGTASGIGPAACASGAGCQVWNLMVPPAGAGILLDQGRVNLGSSGDIYYYQANGVPELINETVAYSLDVTISNAGKLQCATATSQAPDADPITNLHKGLLLCVQTGDGYALLEQTQDLDSSKTLYLRDTFWRN